MTFLKTAQNEIKVSVPPLPLLAHTPYRFSMLFMFLYYFPFTHIIELG